MNMINRREQILIRSIPMIVLGLSVLLFNACSKGTEEAEMFFRVNEELLGEYYSDSLLTIDMRIPVDWVDITEELRMLVDEIYAESGVDYEQGLNFLKSYGNLDEIVFLLLFEFDHSLISNEPEEAILSFLADFSQTTEVLQQGTYSHNEIRFHQMTSQDNNGLINIKLFGYSNETTLFVLDYYIPRDIYVDYIETIESSIGSITEH